MKVVFLIATASVAQAVTTTFVVSGLIADVRLSEYPDVRIGDEFWLTVSYSQGAIDAHPRAEVGDYSPSDFRIVLVVAGAGVIFDEPGTGIGVFTGMSSPTFQILPQISIGTDLSDGPGLTLMFSDTDGSRIKDDSLPLGFSEIDGFDSVGFSIYSWPMFTPGDTSPLIGGRATALAVPEPSIGILLGCGLGLLLVRRSRPSIGNQVEFVAHQPA